MSTRPAISPRSEAILIAAFLVVWFALWLLTPHVSLPIPPYRDHPGASLGIQALAYAWAALLLLLPFLLPLFGCHLAVRHWARGAGSRLLTVTFGAFALFPIIAVGVGILRIVTDPAHIDSARSLLFYWWPI